MSKSDLIPLAERSRPKNLSEIVGQTHIVGKNQFLRTVIEKDQPTSMILWGPPGSGKTTLARIIGSSSSYEYVEISAVTTGLADVRKIIDEAKNRLSGLEVVQETDEEQTEAYMKYVEGAPQTATQQYTKSTSRAANPASKQASAARKTILFVDEIHRFNKAQQDAFLPHVENGTIILIGATTENPSFEVIGPLLSRSRVVVLEPLSKDDIVDIIVRAQRELKNKKIDQKAVELLAELSGGDARMALNGLEVSAELTNKAILPADIKQAMQTITAKFDKGGEYHYNLISAYIKSMRGSDVNATLYYLARMIQGGEDPKFIARRNIIFASEDIGLSAPAALNLAVATFQAVERIGQPECNYNLFECAIVLAKSKKSRGVADAMSKAFATAKQCPDAPVPLHLRNAPTKLMKDLGYQKGTKWETDFKHPKGFLPEELKDFDLQL